MTRPSGQVTTMQALATAAVIVLAVLGTIAGLRALIAPGRLDVALPPAAAAPEVCPPSPSPVDEPVAVSAAQLIECPRTYDGVTVAYEGEVVGMVLRRGPRAWVQLNDDVYGLDSGPLPTHRTALGTNSGVAVSIPVSAVELIDHVGSYREAGDRLAVQGTFLRADPDDAGAPSIRAASVTVVRGGRPIDVPLHVGRAIVAGILLLITLAAAAAIIARRRSLSYADFSD